MSDSSDADAIEPNNDLGMSTVLMASYQQQSESEEKGIADASVSSAQRMLRPLRKHCRAFIKFINASKIPRPGCRKATSEIKARICARRLPPTVLRLQLLRMPIRAKPSTFQVVKNLVSEETNETFCVEQVENILAHFCTFLRTGIVPFLLWLETLCKPMQLT